MNTLVCEQHPWLGWPHGDCSGPGCPEQHMPDVLHDAVNLIRSHAAQGHQGAAEWLDGHGIDSPVAADYGGF